MQLQEQLFTSLTVVMVLVGLSGENNFLYSEIYEFSNNSQVLFYLFALPRLNSFITFEIQELHTP